MIKRRKEKDNDTARPAGEKVIMKQDEMVENEDYDDDFDFSSDGVENSIEPLSEEEMNAIEIEKATLTIMLHNDYAFTTSEHEIKIYPYKGLEPFDINFIRYALSYYFDANECSYKIINLNLANGKELKIESSRPLFNDDIKHIIQSLRYYTS